MLKEDAPYFIVSESGFGGQIFRVANRYIRQEAISPQPTRLEVTNNALITVKAKSSRLGTLFKLSARPDGSPSSPKSKISVVKPTDARRFKDYIRSCRPTKGSLDPEEIPTTTATPESLALSYLLLAISQQERIFDAAGNFRQVILGNSAYPIQSPDILANRIKDCIDRARPFRIGCFACLNLTCSSQNGLPSYSVNVWGETRLELPRIKRKTDFLLEQLVQTRLPFVWDFLVADTDPQEIYGEWLGEDLGDKIDEFISQLPVKIFPPLPEVRIKKWSAVQLNYQVQYQTNFQRVAQAPTQFVGPEYIARSTDRRTEYFTKQGLPDTPEVRQISQITAQRNIALYAAQGPILETEYDCLVIADPDPLRLGKIQSLLAPNLPIWYPYPG